MALRRKYFYKLFHVACNFLTCKRHFPNKWNKKIQNYLESCHRFCVFTRSRKRKVKKSLESGKDVCLPKNRD